MANLLIAIDGSLGSAEKSVDADIAKFNAYFMSLGNDPLTRFEVAAIKTYLYYKLRAASCMESSDQKSSST